tara:strand:- start:67 stop:432 length:366 start_codon:yes stop_codon:yes gene_type:complete
MPLNKKRKFIFIYNAKGGKWNSTLDLVHKYISPHTYKCSLCKITFDIRIKKKWKKFIENSMHNFIFLHKEDLVEHNLEWWENKLPVCLEKKNDEYELVISANKMKKLRNEDELILLFQKIL